MYELFLEGEKPVINIHQIKEIPRIDMRDALKQTDEIGTFDRTKRALLTVLTRSFPPLQFFVSEPHSFERKMNSLFMGTNFNTLIYPSSTPNAFTIPSAPIISKNAKHMGLLTMFEAGHIFVSIEQMINLYKHHSNIEPEVRHGKLYLPNTPEITTYFASRMLEVLNENELKAVLLHEAGHNCHRMFTSFNKALALGSGLLSLYLIKNNIVPLRLMGFIGFLLTFATILLVTRRMEVYADDVAVQCGYGHHLANAFEKINTSITGKAFTDSGWNVFEQIINVLNYISWQISKVAGKLYMVPHPYYKDRVNRARQGAMNTPLTANAMYGMSGCAITEDMLNEGAVRMLLDKLDILLSKLIDYLNRIFE